MPNAKLGAKVDRYSFLVRILHSLLHTGCRVMRSRSIITSSAASAPLAGTSRLRRLAAYARCHRCAYSHRPRQPTAGSELSLMLFHNMSSSETTGNSSAALTQYFTENSGLQLGIKVSAFPSSSHSDSGEVCVFEA